MENYETKAVTSKISATNRASIKIRDSYFTVEFSEERVIPDNADVDLQKEKDALWESVTAEVDNQIESIIASVQQKRG